jgi:hypothetical protein
MMDGKTAMASQEHIDALAHNGAIEEQMASVATVPQRTDQTGTKVEDLAGTGEQDSQGG